MLTTIRRQKHFSANYKLCKIVKKWRRERDSNLETVSRLHAFQACAFNHSATSPKFLDFLSSFYLFSTISNIRSCITGPAKYVFKVPLQKTLILSDFCFINFLIGKLFILRFTIWLDKKKI